MFFPNFLQQTGLTEFLYCILIESVFLPEFFISGMTDLKNVDDYLSNVLQYHTKKSKYL